MALVECKACGKQISENAKECPHCGEPVAQKKKTSLLTWFVLILFIFFIVGTVENKTLDKGSNSNRISKNSATTIENKRGGGCKVSDFIITESSGWAEGEYYKVPISIKNNCTHSAGLKVQASFYDKNNNLIHATSFWPASVSNIQSHDTFNDTWIGRVNGTVNRYTFKGIDVKKWK